MTLIPEFEIGVWNAWIFIVPYVLFNFGLPFLTINRKSTFWMWPSYTKLEKICLIIGMLLMGSMWIYSIFLPFSIGTIWLYAGLFVYLLGWVPLVLAYRTFTTTTVDKPNTTGIYRFSRHPWYLGMLLLYVGTGIASSSWIYILFTLLLLATYRTAYMIPEERMCCEKFGNEYNQYMNQTSRWIGGHFSTKA